MLNILRTSYGHLTDTFNTFYNISQSAALRSPAGRELDLTVTVTFESGSGPKAPDLDPLKRDYGDWRARH